MIITARKKPVEIQACQYDGGNIAELRGWADVVWSDEHGSWAIKTLEGDAKLEVGAYVIKGVQGEFYPCRQDIFESTYERTDRADPSQRPH